MKFKLLSAVILTALSATAFSATEQTFSDGLKINLNEKNTGSYLLTYKGKPTLVVANIDKNKISHNYFDEFNVGKEGLYIKNTNKADTIISEVVSNSASVLKGGIEILNNPANLIIANPNGITTRSGFTTENIKNLELATAKIADTSNKDNIKMINSKDGRLRIVRTNITPDAKLDKLSLISNKISIRNSKLNSNELNFNLLTSSKSKKTLSDIDAFVDARGPSSTDKVKVTILNRKPSELYITADTEVTANNVNINLLETKFINEGSIHGRDNLNITSRTQTAGSSSMIDNGDITHMYNKGTLKGINIAISANDKSRMENHGKINARSWLEFNLFGDSKFTNYQDVILSNQYNSNKTHITFEYSTFENNGNMKSKNMLIENRARGEFINTGELQFDHRELNDYEEHTIGKKDDRSFKFTNSGNSYDLGHDIVTNADADADIYSPEYEI